MKAAADPRESFDPKSVLAGCAQLFSFICLIFTDAPRIVTIYIMSIEIMILLFKAFYSGFEVFFSKFLNLE